MIAPLPHNALTVAIWSVLYGTAHDLSRAEQIMLDWTFFGSVP